MQDTLRMMAASRQWEKIPFKAYHGINTPLFSLRSERGAGIGEYADLIPFIHWCQEVGFNLIQLLPLNDTGDDPSPYNAQSTLALHPIYLSLRQLPNIELWPDLMRDISHIQVLNTSVRVDYQRVLKEKLSFLRRYVDREGKIISQVPEYQIFKMSHPWVKSYATFKALKERYGGKHWQHWAKEHAPVFPNEISFHTIVQFLCFSQMHQAKKAAMEANVLLKGDIPILLSSDSVDVWEQTGLFDLDQEVGAAPDSIVPQGQKWGFPVCHWEKAHVFWQSRLNVAETCYHLYRIDHALGFFRLWVIPKGREAMEGTFFPNDPAAWITQGQRLLTHLLATTEMLPIAEDLGLVSEEIRQAIIALGIPGTRVIRWENGVSLSSYHPLTLSTVSTHDWETLRQWWQTCPQERHHFCAFHHLPHEELFTQPLHLRLLYDSHHTSSIFHANLLQEYLSLVPDYCFPSPDQERINIPGTIGSHNWTFRYIPTIEALSDNAHLRDLIRQIIY